jgi:hypothetical protein
MAIRCMIFVDFTVEQMADERRIEFGIIFGSRNFDILI